jgi:hypothetical protein
MNSIGIMIRRRNRTNKKLLDKEIITLHSKLKKKDTYNHPLHHRERLFKGKLPYPPHHPIQR